MKDDSESTRTASPTSYWKMLPQQGTPEVPLQQNEVPHACTHMCTYTHLDTEYL